MQYEQFTRILQIPNINSTDHIALVLTFTNDDEQLFLQHFYDNTQNVKIFYHCYFSGFVYIVVNSDIVLSDNLGDYDTVVDLPILEQEQV